MTKRSTPRLPHQGRLNPAAIVQLTIAIGAGVAASPGARLLNPGDLGASGPLLRAVLVVSTVILSCLLVRFALRRTAVGSAFSWCLVGGVIAGALNGGIVLASVAILERGDVVGALKSLVMGTLFAGIFAGPLGAMYGCAYSLLVCAAVKARLQPSHAGGDHLLALSGAWLAVVGIIVALGNSRGEVEPWSGIAAAAVGSLASIVGLARVFARRRFVRRVAAGRAEHFAIVPRRMTPAEASLLPMTAEGPWGGVLVARNAAERGPYRSVEDDVPLALATLVDG